MLKDLLTTVAAIVLSSTVCLAADGSDNAYNVGQGSPTPQLQFEMRRGRVMQCEVPAGWAFHDTTNGVDVSSPNGRAQMSHTYLRGCGRTSPDLYMQSIVRQAMQSGGVSNVQLISVKDVGPGTKLYELDYTVFGQPVHAMSQVNVRPGPEGFIAEMIRVQTAPELFQQYLPVLAQMAKSVQVVDGNAFCANGKMNGEIVAQNNIRTQSIHDVAAIRNDGIAHQNAVRDDINQGSDDYIRDQTRFDGPDGSQYVGPLQAVRMFKHADGSITYSTNSYDSVPPDAIELSPHR